MFGSRDTALNKLPRYLIRGPNKLSCYVAIDEFARILQEAGYEWGWNFKHTICVIYLPDGPLELEVELVVR